VSVALGAGQREMTRGRLAGRGQGYPLGRMQNPEQETGRLGETRRAISRSIVTVLKEHLGRGPVKAKTYLHADSVLVLMFNGHTVAEETLGAEGEAESVASQRVKASKESKSGLTRSSKRRPAGRSSAS